MAANLLASVDFYCSSYCCRDSAFVPCLIMFFLVDERGHLAEKKSVADNIYMSETSYCVVSLSKTHLSLF